MDARIRKLCLMSLSLILHAAVFQTRMHLSRRDRRGRRRRRWWVRPVNRSRKGERHYDNLFRELKESDHEEFNRFTRMIPAKFYELLSLVTPFLQKRSIRKPLPTELRLALTLTYLAHGDSVNSKCWDFRIGRSTAHKIIPEVCSAIWKALQPIYLPPMDEERWTKVAEGFQDKWQFPNCVGAVDGKHVRIKALFRSGTQYFCYKKFFSIVLMAACDSEYRFIWVDIGQYGSLSDGSVWANSEFGQMLDNNEADLPPPRNLPHSTISSPYYFVGDEAFSLKLHMMRPYSRKDLGDAERIFNYRLSRARRVIENAFGILVSRWQIYSKSLCASPHNATTFVMATVCLHNFLMSRQSDSDGQQGRLCCPPDLIDREDECHNLVEGGWRDVSGHGEFLDMTRLGTNNCPKTPFALRGTLRDYFLSPIGERQAPWQYASAFRGLVINANESFE